VGVGVGVGVGVRVRVRVLMCKHILACTKHFHCCLSAAAYHEHGEPARKCREVVSLDYGEEFTIAACNPVETCVQQFLMYFLGYG